jgi:hypothetical protein
MLDERRHLVDLATETDKHDTAEIRMIGISAQGTTQDVKTFARTEAATRAMDDGDDAIDILETR